MTTTFKNLTNRMQTVILEHRLAPRRRANFNVSEHNPKTGEIRRVKKVRTVPDSVSIPAGGEVTDLPDWAAVVPDAKRLRKAGKLAVKRTEGKPVKKVASKKPKAAKKADTSKKTDSGETAQEGKN